MNIATTFLATYDPGDKETTRSPHWRLLFIATLSLLLHGVLLSKIDITGKGNATDYTRLSLSLSPLSPEKDAHSHILKSKDITKPEISPGNATDSLNKPSKIRIKTPPAADEKSDSELSAASLITRSRASIQSGKLTTTSASETPLFIGSGDTHQPADIDAHRLADGTLKIKMKSLFGGYQCFEAPEQPSLDNLVEEIWRHSRC